MRLFKPSHNICPLPQSSGAYAEQILPLIQDFEKHQNRRKQTISLTANENVLSNTARALGQNRHYDRYFFDCLPAAHQHYAANYAGMQIETFPEVINLRAAADRACQHLFGADFVEYRTLSGVHCTMAILAGLTKPGSIVISIANECGGHFATRHITECLGRQHLSFDLDAEAQPDLQQLQAQFKAHGEKIGAIIFEHGLTTRPIPVAEVKQLLREHGLEHTLLIYDASHMLGLIAGRAFPNPLDQGADILQGNTHKSFPGPHRALVMCRDLNLGTKIHAQIGAGLISSPQLPTLLQLFVTLLEMEHYAAAYANAMLDNAALLAQELEEIPGLQLQPTQTHILLLQGEQAGPIANRLNELGLRVNDKKWRGQSFLRLGVQEITRLGISREAIPLLAQLLREVADNKHTAKLKMRAAALASDLQQVHYSFDQEGWYAA